MGKARQRMLEASGGAVLSCFLASKHRRAWGDISLWV